MIKCLCFFLLLHFSFSLLAEEGSKNSSDVTAKPSEDKASDSDKTPEATAEFSLKQEEYVLDYRNRAGRNLIYDCQRDFYACVDDISSDNCLKQRALAKKAKNYDLSCAFFKRFETKKECLLQHYKMLDKKSKPFCFRKRQ